MTVSDVAAYLKVKPKTVYAWAGEGKIPAVKIHGLLRFRHEEIEAWAKSFERPATPAPKFPGRPSGGSRTDIDRIVDRARREVLRSRPGEARPAVKPGKEG
ncbi:MAG: helix-turn-helix domain-containing protein [Nitrospirae bacterium]|nr:helix-turn-helix domain-containing protein [Nitrospirota bacterium]MBI3391978.1 helix-turn-helix domain-containing protein [Nitrospirota bacterium]